MTDREKERYAEGLAPSAIADFMLRISLVNSNIYFDCYGNQFYLSSEDEKKLPLNTQHFVQWARMSGAPLKDYRVFHYKAQYSTTASPINWRSSNSTTV